MIRVVFLFSVFLFTAACASSPVSTKSAAVAPTSNIYAPEVFAAREGQGQIVLTRDSSFSGKCALGIYLDGKLVGAIEREQKLVMYATPGEHIIGAGPNPNGGGVCNWFSDSMRREVSINVSHDKSANYRLAMVSGTISLMPTAFE